MAALTSRPPSDRALILTALQAATLQEIGISRHLLTGYLPQAPESRASAKPSTRTPVKLPGKPAVAPKQSLAALATDILHTARQQHRQLPTPPTSPSTRADPIAPAEFVLPDWAASVLAQPGSAFDLMVVSETPGLHDATHARTSQDRMGVLLHAMLNAAGMTPKTAVFYTHLLPLRPLISQGASAQELAAGLAYVRQQIALLRPRRILALGQVVAQVLLGKSPGSEPLAQLRGHAHTYEQDDSSIVLIATYPPAVLLTRPHYKAAVWQDLNLLELAASEAS